MPSMKRAGEAEGAEEAGELGSAETIYLAPWKIRMLQLFGSGLISLWLDGWGTCQAGCFRVVGCLAALVSPLIPTQLGRP